MKPNKWIKIISINLLLILLVFSVIEFSFFKAFQKKFENMIKLQITLSKDQEFNKKFFVIKYHRIIPFDYSYIKQKNGERVYKGTKKGSIVTIGCSYTEGNNLKETFAYKLNKLTGRTTYNRGFSGTGPGLVYRQLSDENFKNEVDNPDYIIYTFLFNHIYRQFKYMISPYVGNLDINYYIDKANNFKEVKHPFYSFYSLFTVKRYIENRCGILAWEEKQNHYPLFKRTMLECVKAIKKNFPNTKFVLLEFPESLLYSDHSGPLPEDVIKYLESLGIIYINVEDLIGHKITDEYRLSDKDHPNEKAWDEIVPALVKKLNL